jgi:hypothetical protein
MSTRHGHFELLCVQAELEQLSPSEVIEFREHCQTCAGCRQRVLDYARLHATMAVTNGLNRRLHQAPPDMTRRFITRANREGVPLNQRASTAGSANLILAGAAFVVLLLAAIVIGRTHIAPFRATMAQADIATSLPPPTATRPNLDGVKNSALRIAPSVNLHRRVVSSQRANLSMPSSGPSSQALMDNALTEITQAEWFNSTTLSPRFKFSVAPEKAEQEPNLLIACVCGPLVPLGSRAYFDMASSAHFFRPDGDASITSLTPDFRPDPATFQLIENVRQ